MSREWWEALRAIREKRGLSIGEVARRAEAAGLKLNRPQLSLIESGQRPDTAHRTVATVLAALKASWREYERHL